MLSLFKLPIKENVLDKIFFGICILLNVLSKESYARTKFPSELTK